MGQPVAVVEKPSTTPGVVRFEANRTLTGMGHERFTSVEDAQGPRPAAELARRLLATGRIDLVHIYGNVITVELKRGYDAQGLKDVVEDLYIYYTPGFVPPPLEMPAEEAPAAPAGGGWGRRSGGGRSVGRRVGGGQEDPGAPAGAQPPGQGASQGQGGRGLSGRGVWPLRSRTPVR